MKQTTTQIEDLSQLTELDASKRRLESGTPEFKKLNVESDRVRERLPASILHHYDLRVSKGKRGAAKLRNNVCGGCYISLPSGQMADLLREDMGILICGNCSILILPGDVPPPAAAPAAMGKLVTKPVVRKRKVKVKAAPESANQVEPAEESAL